MAISKNQSLTNKLLDLITTAFSDGYLEIRSGIRPVSVESAPTGDVLVSVKLPISPWNNSISGSATLAGEWYATSLISGTATWFRMYNNTKDKWMDGNVGISGSDLNINSTSIVAGNVVKITTFNISFGV